jgi:phosphoribosylanthranilate isomerase
MAFLTKIKLGSVNNLSDARYAAAAGIDYIGFCFDPLQTPYIAPIKAKEIIDWITGSYVVGEFGEQSLQEIADISELLNIDVIEVENRLYPNDLKTLQKPIIKKLDIEKYSNEELKNELHEYALVADAFHLYAGSHKEHINQVIAENLIKEYRIIWGFSISVDLAKKWVTSQQPFCINIAGGEEERPGVKDFDEIADLLDQLTTEEF